MYKYQDADGVIHYSNKPMKGGKPVQLPQIMKGEVKLTSQKLISCDKHGGINCQAGSDSDGSVICYDGFREASPRFRFSCNSAKLEISDVSDPREDGSFTVFVRNAKSVAASKTALRYKPEGGREVKLNGPSEIEPFGVAEFVYEPAVKAKEGEMLNKPTLAQLDVICANCS